MICKYTSPCGDIFTLMILSVPHFTETIILLKKQTNITAIVIMSGSTNEFDQSNPLDKQLKQHPFTTSKTRYG